MEAGTSGHLSGSSGIETINLERVGLTRASSFVVNKQLWLNRCFILTFIYCCLIKVIRERYSEKGCCFSDSRYSLAKIFLMIQNTKKAKQAPKEDRRRFVASVFEYPHFNIVHIYKYPPWLVFVILSYLTTNFDCLSFVVLSSSIYCCFIRH